MRILQGVRILLVEDDFIVAFDMQTMLQDYGAEVLGPAASLEEARKLLTIARPTLAVLDVNLNGELVFALASELRDQSVPILFATAYADDDPIFPADHKQAPRVAKPVLPAMLITQLRKLLGR